MVNGYEVRGSIHSVGETTEFGSNGFTKRECVIQLQGDGESSAYPNYVALEFVKDKCALLDNYSVGDDVNVSFNLTGRLWSAAGKPEKCFTNLRAWRINSVASSAPFSEESSPQEIPANKGFDDYDDIPF